ncbi:Mariner Mos1 transposase [Eumeta japonica]|uniref:Mariner Mos1 transposase n=1 Tax=Eumeta variegata TaxID=151549 RepID=A0A4C1VS92_EUMVA|nr:Mariner Mos1 transposase [Eumeta japonica]
MSAYEPNSRHLRKVLIFCFNLKKSVAEAHQMLSNTYGEAAISERMRREWFQRFKNGHFDVEDQYGGGKERRIIGSDGTSHFKTPESHGNDSETRTLVPYELKPRDIERCLFASEQLLARQRRKGFLHCIVTGEEKWVHYDNPKCRKSWGYPGHASKSTGKPNIHGSKVMLSICWTSS